jgi:hypothetical protein
MEQDDRALRARKRLRPPGWVALLGGAALAVSVAASCSSGSAAPRAQGQSKYAQALSYAQCMRSHGVPGFPDPNSQGEFALAGSGVSSAINPASAQFQTAQNACHHLDPHTGIESPQQHAQNISQALRYVQCMRSHGIANFPDPPSSGKLVFNPQKLGIDPNSPQYQNAQNACRKYLTAAGAVGP